MIEARRFPDHESLSRAAADLVTGVASRSRGAFDLVLPGGRTPRRLLELLASPPWSDGVPWARVRLWWGDERFVPPDDPESNYGLARRLLLERLPLPPARVFPIDTSLPSPEEAGEAYERLLLGLAGPGGARAPRFDLALLGVGADGHTASLFPGDPVLDEKTRLAAAVTAPPPHPVPRRVTMTPRALGGAETLVFLASGPEKAAAVRAVLEGAGEAARLPAARVRGRARTLWLVSP